MPHRRRLALLLSTILLSTFSGVSLSAAQGSLAAPLSLDDAVERALDRNPDVLRARAEVEAAELARRGAGAPSANPALTVEGGPRIGTSGPQADVGVSLEIPFDLGATSRRRRAATSDDLDASRSRLAWTELTVATTTRELIAAALAADGRVALAEGAFALAVEMERVARRRHELGEVSILEPNFAGLERTDAQAALLSARLDRSRAYRSLGALLAIPEGDSLVLADVAVPAWPDSLPSALPHWTERVADRPDLAAARAAARAADADLAVARGNGAPGLSATAGWAREGDEANLVTGGLRFELPLQRNQLGVAGAQGDAAVAAIDLDTASLAVPRELASALDAWEAAAARYALATGDALPLAEQSLSLVLRAYGAGKEELLAVLLMQRQALTARRAAIDAELALHRAAAALERAVGLEVF